MLPMMVKDRHGTVEGVTLEVEALEASIIPWHAKSYEASRTSRYQGLSGLSEADGRGGLQKYVS